MLCINVAQTSCQLRGRVRVIGKVRYADLEQSCSESKLLVIKGALWLQVHEKKGCVRCARSRHAVTVSVWWCNLLMPLAWSSRVPVCGGRTKPPYAALERCM